MFQKGKKYKYYEYSSAHFTHSKESHLPVKKVTLLNWLTGVLNHTLLCMPVLFWPALRENFYVPSLLFISSIPRAALKPTNLKFYSLTVLQISVLNVSNSCLALFLWCSLSANLFWGAHLALCFWFVNLLWWKLAVKDVSIHPFCNCPHTAEHSWKWMHWSFCVTTLLVQPPINVHPTTFLFEGFCLSCTLAPQSPSLLLIWVTALHPGCQFKYHFLRSPFLTAEHNMYILF